MIAELVADLGPMWQRTVGAGAEHQLMFTDRPLATLVHLRRAVIHDVLAAPPSPPRSGDTPSLG